MSDYTEQNAAISRIMGWELQQFTHEGRPFDLWVRGVECTMSVPDYCGSDRWAAEFRQHTMPQDWCSVIMEWAEMEGFEYKVATKRHGIHYHTAETEAAACSLACLAAWQAMEKVNA